MRKRNYSAGAARGRRFDIDQPIYTMSSIRKLIAEAFPIKIKPVNLTKEQKLKRLAKHQYVSRVRAEMTEEEIKERVAHQLWLVQQKGKKK